MLDGKNNNQKCAKLKDGGFPVVFHKKSFLMFNLLIPLDKLFKYLQNG